MRFSDKQIEPLDDEYREMLGFMIAIAVIFIVGTLALGIYKDYIYKSSVSAVFINILDVKARLHEHYVSKSVFPDSDDIRSYLAAIDSMSYESYEIFVDEGAKVASAVITVSIKSKYHEIDKDTISFIAMEDSSKGALVWLCGYAQHQDYPFTIAYNKTTLKREYLPEICRD